MTFEEIIEEVNELSLEKQLVLLEILSRQIRSRLKGTSAEEMSGILGPDQGWTKEKFRQE